MAPMKTTEIFVDGVENFRDLGGYPLANGSKIPMGKFFRSAALHDITPQGIKTLQGLNIEYIIDLRSAAELALNGNNTEDLPEITYVHLPMLDHLNSSIAAGEWVFPESMLVMYQQILEQYQDEFQEMFEIFARAEGGVVFHCTAGKDRTGVTTMLLYGLAGVDPTLIAEDYSYSEQILGIQENLPPEIPAYVVRTKPEYMKDTMQWLEKEYGGVPEYLTAIGVSDDTQAAVRRKLGATE